MAITDGLSATQLACATAMVAEVKRRGLPKRAAVIVLETGMVESGLRVLANTSVPASMSVEHEDAGNDHDSVGPLQQRVPSWGTAAECMDPTTSTAKFLDGANANPGLLTLPDFRFQMVGHPQATSWDQLPTGSAAQAVQVSAFPDRYQEHEKTAQALVDALWPTVGGSGTDEEEDDVGAAITVSKSTHPSTKNERFWVIGPTGMAEVEESEAQSVASVLGVKIVECSEVAVAAGRKLINAALRDD